MAFTTRRAQWLQRQQQERSSTTTAAAAARIFCRHQWLVLIPTMILLLEHLSRFLFKTAADEDVGLALVRPSFEETRRGHGALLPLSALTRSRLKEKTECPPNLVLRENVEYNHGGTLSAKVKQQIPRIMHQTSKSRCLTHKITKATAKWKLHLDEDDDSWSYYFHDDESLHRLLLQVLPEFPQLEQVARHCLLHGTLQADLWRYLVLWLYGGVYADLDAVPGEKFVEAKKLFETADALFVVEQYHMLSQWFMAVSPRHPLMFYAIQISLTNLSQAPDTGTVNAAFITGPHALHEAFRRFRRDAGGHVLEASQGNQPVQAGHFSGTDNRTVTAVGVAAKQDQYVLRDVLGAHKRNEYRKMGMRHFQDDLEHPSGKSCLLSLYEAHLSTVKSQRQ